VLRVGSTQRTCGGWRARAGSARATYPGLPARARDVLLAFAERALGAGRFDPARAEELFR
jgi:hypothetical protein